MAQGRAIAFLALGLSIGLTLLTLGCALDNVWWPMMELIAFAIIPLPAILCPPQQFAMETNPMQLIGNFVNGFILVGILALPFVQLHIGAISVLAMILVTLSNIVNFCSVIAYIAYSQKESGGF